MPSILPGYEYDIFISYRQNDNRSGWVTEFIKNLQEELAATLKEPVSLYFDSNPHDGLLENHHVDKSLEGKLRCLIFIPVLSQTYCDTRSFAWQHEFRAFNKLATSDPLGRDIRLKSGNVASRILPIKIHELDEEDRSTIEKEIGGALRAIDFIYDSAGVNRPLLPSDSPEKNLNHTLYRDQINKVARSVKDLMLAIQHPNVSPGPRKAAATAPQPVLSESGRKRITWIAAVVLFVGLLTLSGYYFAGLGRNLGPSVDRTIAVLPFKLIGNDEEGKYFAEGVADALINHLHGIPNVKVRSRTSVEKFTGSASTIPEIGKELGVLYVLEGSTQKYKDNVRIIVQLINTQTDDHVWFKEYNAKFDDIFRIQSEIALNITSELNVRLTGAQKARVQKIPTKNVEAWDLYLRGTEYRRNSWKYFEPRDRAIAADFFTKAIKKDPGFAEAYVSLAYVSDPNLSKDSVFLLINKAIELDPELPDSYEWLGFHFMNLGEFDKAISFAEKAIRIDSTQNFLLTLGRIHRAKGDHLNALACYHEAFQKEKTEYYPWLLEETSWSYLCIGLPDLARQFSDVAISLEPDNLEFLTSKAHRYTAIGEYDSLLETVTKTMAIRNDNVGLQDLAHVYLLKGDYVRSAEAYGKFYALDNPALSMWCKDKASFAFALRKLGREKEAGKLVREGKKCLEEGFVNWGAGVNYDLAKVYAFLGDEKKALSYLEAWTVDWGIQDFIELDPLFGTMRDNPEFKRVVEKHKQTIEQRRLQAEKGIAEGKLPTMKMVR